MHELELCRFLFDSRARISYTCACSHRLLVHSCIGHVFPHVRGQFPANIDETLRFKPLQRDQGPEGGVR